MKKYLLGMLNEADASSVEERYFVDRQFFLQVQAVERQLVEDYLDGRLGWRRRRYFRRRYLRSPALSQIVESAAARRPPKTQIRRAPRWVAAGAALLAIAAVVYSSRRPPQKAHPSIGVRQAATFVLQLYPTIRKDGSSQFPSLQLPSSASIVRLIANLPGGRAGTGYLPRISAIGASDTATPVWNGSLQMSTAATHGEQVILSLNSGLLHTGDYFLELDTADHSIQYLCPFRILLGNR